MSSRRSGVFVGVLLILVATAGSAIHHVRAQRPSSPPAAGNESVTSGAEVVAVVNGTPIGSDELDVRLEQLLPIASYHGLVEPDRLLPLRRAALDDLVLDELIYREATAADRRARAETVEADLAAVKARFDNAGQFATALRENGLTEDGFRRRLARNVLVREARAEHARQVVVTEADITAYYRQNPAKFQHPERVHLLEILFRTDPAEPLSTVAAERKARATLARLRRGEDFGTIASASSEDEYRVKDGDMGLVHRGRLDAEFEAAVFSTPPGRFEIARSLYGFEVFKVLERQPSTQLSLEEARPIIAESLERQRREEGLRAWHARLLVGARIEIRDAALRNAHAAKLPMLPMDPSARPRPTTMTRNHR